MPELTAAASPAEPLDTSAAMEKVMLSPEASALIAHVQGKLPPALTAMGLEPGAWSSTHTYPLARGFVTGTFLPICDPLAAPSFQVDFRLSFMHGPLKSILMLLVTARSPQRADVNVALPTLYLDWELDAEPSHIQRSAISALVDHQAVFDDTAFAAMANSLSLALMP